MGFQRVKRGMALLLNNTIYKYLLTSSLCNVKYVKTINCGDSMATTTRKKKNVRRARRITGMAAMPLDKWNSARFYTHYEVESREWGSTLKGFIKKNYDKDQQAAISKLPDWKISAYSHWATTAYLLEHAPNIVPDVYREGLKKYIDKLIQEGTVLIQADKKSKTAKKNVYVPNIQERLEEAAEEKTAEIDEWVDQFLLNPRKNPLKEKTPLNSFRANEVNVGHARFIQKWYEGSFNELQELISLPAATKQTEMQKQLAEGYNHLKKTQQRELYEFYNKIMQAVDIIKAEQKQKRAPRKIKPKSPADLVKSLKFKSSDSQFGIASVNPADIVGATTVIVFNCKNRKLGVYHAEEHQTIQVKGTTLQFFDEDKSLQKTVRKPEEILPEWKKITKTETKMNGRINSDTVILKVFK